MNSGRTHPDLDEIALKHAWDWFSLHANQRMQSINLLLVSVALAVTGYGVAFQSKNYIVAAVICCAGVMIALCFAGLDIRNRQLVRAAEAALRTIEDRLAVGANVEELRFVDAVERPTAGLISYTNIVRSLALIAAIIFVVGAYVAWTYSVELAVPSIVQTPAPSHMTGQ